MILVDPRISYFDLKMRETFPEEYRKIIQDMDEAQSGEPEGVVREWDGAKIDILNPGSGPLPDVPVIVLSATEGWTAENWGLPQPVVDPLKEFWYEGHERLAKSVIRGFHILAEGAGHAITY